MPCIGLLSPSCYLNISNLDTAGRFSVWRNPIPDSAHFIAPAAPTAAMQVTQKKEEMNVYVLMGEAEYALLFACLEVRAILFFYCWFM